MSSESSTQDSSSGKKKVVKRIKRDRGINDD